MIRDIAYYLIFGKPVVVYLGLLTFLSFLTAAVIGMNVLKPKNGIPFKYHILMVRVSFTIAIVHAFFVLSLYNSY
jgi:hypothetical protein